MDEKKFPIEIQISGKKLSLGDSLKFWKFGEWLVIIYFFIKLF